ncbi:MAG: histidine kinase dimerization/phosphoacceptor domain -containing protein [Methanoregula sp.]
MITILPFDIMVLVNLLLSIIVVSLSVWGYIRIGKPTPLYFGLAYVLFSVSHLLLLSDIEIYDELPIVMIRTSGYIFVVIGLFAIIKDILKRQRVEKALRESEERLSATFDQAAVGIAEILPDFRISRSNRKFSGILGFTSNELSAMTLRDLITPEGQLRHFDKIEQVIQGNDLSGYSAEMQVLMNTGQTTWCQVFLSAVTDNLGEPKYFILVLEDISLRKRAEDDLALLNASLEERILGRTAELHNANKSLVIEVDNRKKAEAGLKDSLIEKEVLLKEIHHRVKNNLQIIISILFLQAQKTTDPASVAVLNDSQSRIQSMALVHQKLYQSGDLASIDFDSYLNNLVSNLMTTYGVDKSRITCSVDVKNLSISIHSAIPVGLLMNELVSNSFKYAFPDNRSGEITLRGAEEGDKLVFRVKDNGVGIPEETDWEHLDSLGLNLVRMLTRQMKGKITLSRQNGTEFILTIPKEDRRAPQ